MTVKAQGGWSTEKKVIGYRAAIKIQQNQNSIPNHKKKQFTVCIYVWTQCVINIYIFIVGYILNAVTTFPY